MSLIKTVCCVTCEMPRRDLHMLVESGADLFACSPVCHEDLLGYLAQDEHLMKLFYRCTTIVNEAGAVVVT